MWYPVPYGGIAEERLEDMLRLERSLRGGLEDLAQQIDAYADSLERADSWLAEQL